MSASPQNQLSNGHGTEPTQTELELNENEAFLHTLLEAIPVPVFYKDLEGHYQGVNRAFEIFFGAARNALLGKTAFDICPPELAEIYRRQDQEVFRNAEIQVYESQVENAAGELRDVVFHKAVYRDGNGDVAGLIGAILDITDRNRAQSERLIMEAQLRQSQKLESIGTLAGGVAHEVNNPINGIMNYAQLIRDRIGGTDETVDEYAAEIIHETERVATLVRNLLSFARHKEEHHSHARMCDIVEDTLSLLRAVLRHDQITITVDVPEELPELKCRSQQIQQVIMNLVTNSRDALNAKYPQHHENKRIAISASLKNAEMLECRDTGMLDCRDAGMLECWDTGIPQSPNPSIPASPNPSIPASPNPSIPQSQHPLIRLTVEDHGGGIPEDVRERMFDPFYTTKPREKGTGLGLSITYGIVKEHHGQLTVETEPGEWTRFHVDLPVDNGWDLGTTT